VTASYEHGRISPEDFSGYDVAFREDMRSWSQTRLAEHLAGRVCAGRALQHLGLYTDAVGTNSDRSPRWPDKVVGSITHDKFFAAAAVARRSYYRSIGIDAETIMTAEHAVECAPDILTSKEMSAFNNFDDSARRTYVTLLFSLKESVYKALYPLTKQFFDFHSVACTNIDFILGRVDLTLTNDITVQWPRGSLVRGYFWLGLSSVFTLVAIAAVDAPFDDVSDSAA
jgi:enterobactin synthetase component D / holo-[acyl-carrier protein] synthase